MRASPEVVLKAVILRPPASLLEERQRTGADRQDEVWEGVLHMLPPPSRWHQRFGSELLAALLPVAEARGLELSYATGLYRPGSADRDYRTPDLVFARPEQASERGVEGAELVVEILSEGDESREKLAFYEQLNVSEALLVDPESREFELYVLRGGRLHVALPDEQGAVRSRVLGVVFSKVGAKLRMEWPGSSAEI
ncbi:MAG: Uma2 family endonuclease [Myxococcales bacterium]